MELTSIAMKGIKHEPLPLREYQRTVTTLVKGRLRPAYFGIQELPRGVCRLPLSASHLAIQSKSLALQ